MRRPAVFACFVLCLAVLSAAACGSSVTIVDDDDDGASCESQGFVTCNGECFDLYSDPLHCGSCTLACGKGQSCQLGVCTFPSCAPGQVDCFGTCTELATDPAHCGSCNIGCDYDEACAQGQCIGQCPSPTVNCFGSCVNTQLDEQHCGQCGTPCFPGETCAGGFCTICDGRCGLCNVDDLLFTLPIDMVSSTAGLSDLHTPQCTSSSSPEEAWSFVAPFTGEFTFHTAGSSFDTVLSILGGCTEIACDDDGLGTASIITLPLVVGEEVLVVVQGFAEDSGEYQLHVSSEGPPPPCPEVDLGSFVPVSWFGDTIGKPDQIPSTCAFTGGGDATISFTAPTDGTYVFDTFGSDFDTVLEVRDGGCFGFSLGCDDNTAGLQSELTLDLFAGQIVTVHVDGFGEGTYLLHIALEGATECFPIFLPSTVPQVLSGDTTFAFDDGSGNCNLNGTAPDDAYLFTAPFTATYSFDTSGSPFDTVLYARAASCEGPELACDDDAGAGLNSLITVPLVAGETIVLFVDGWGSSMGPYTLAIDAM